MAKRIQDRKEDRAVSKSRPTAMNISSLSASKFLHRIESDCIYKYGDADSFGKTRQQDEYWIKLIRRSVDFSSATKGCILWRVDGKAAVRPVASWRRRFEDSNNSEAKTWCYKGESFAQNHTAWVQPFAHGVSSSVDQDSRKGAGATWDHYLHISPNIALYGSRLLHGQENLWKTIWRSYGRFECEFCYSENVHGCHSSSSSSSRKRLWHELTLLEEHCRTVMTWKWELISEQKKKSLVSALQISTMLRGCWQAYCVKRLVVSPSPKPKSSPTLCFVWEFGRWSCCDLDEKKLDGNRKTITTRVWIESMDPDGDRMDKNESQESRRWASSKRFKNSWKVYSVNLSISTAEASSFQCRMTL